MADLTVGDVIKCIDNIGMERCLTVGKKYMVEKINKGLSLVTIKSDLGINVGALRSRFVLEKAAIQEDEFEDEWILNDGKVSIPSDAETVKSASGSVVAFRKKKEYEPKFGEMFLVDSLPVHHLNLSEYECVDNMLVAVCIGIGKAALKTKSGYDYTINFRGYRIKEYPKS